MCYSPYNDTLTAAAVAVKTGGVSLQPWTARGSVETKKNIFVN
jgi:hypothetical protein